jgi:putative ATPase
MILNKRFSSLIFWGPPGTGKTTIARLIAKESGLHFIAMSAIFTGVGELRKVFDQARQRQELGLGTLLFIDEIHRFNRSQQDSFLPLVEEGTLILIGATTENPSFEINAALLSRMQVIVLNRLDHKALEILIQKAEKAIQKTLPITEEARALLKDMADGDGRYLFMLIENLMSAPSEPHLDCHQLMAFVQKRAPLYDKGQEGHYNLISALHKSLRGSDTDAALYWMARILEGGEDPLFILRRLTRFANEDIGLADPEAIKQALMAWEIYEKLGSPEGELAIAQLVIYLGTAPKSNAAYQAYAKARHLAQETGSLMPPKHSLNAPTQMMKDLGYHKNYKYDHDDPDGFSGQNYFPDTLPRKRLYHPVDRGFEREISKRLAYWDQLRLKKMSQHEQ